MAIYFARVGQRRFRKLCPVAHDSPPQEYPLEQSSYLPVKMSERLGFRKRFKKVFKARKRSAPTDPSTPNETSATSVARLGAPTNYGSAEQNEPSSTETIRPTTTEDEESVESSHLPPSATDDLDSVNTMQRYEKAAKNLKDAVKAIRRKEWGTFEFTEIESVPEHDVSKLRDEISKAMTARKDVVANPSRWSKV